LFQEEIRWVGSFEGSCGSNLPFNPFGKASGTPAGMHVFGASVLKLVLYLQILVVGSTSRHGDGDGGVSLARAEKHFKSGLIDDALAELEHARAAFPLSPRPLAAMATVLLESRREHEAVEILRRAAELHRQHPRLSAVNLDGVEDGFGVATRGSLLTSLATLLYQAGDAVGAADACAEALTVQPLHARCYYIHGVAMLSSGRWREAGGERSAQASLAASARLFSTAGDRTNALFALASLRLRAGQMAHAAIAFEGVCVCVCVCVCV